MRTTVSLAGLVFLLALPATAAAQGYPTAKQANAFALEHNIHGYCGKPLFWACATSAQFPAVANCWEKRGLHSRDCFPIEWEEVRGWSYRGCYMHGWVRLETDGHMTFHVDYQPRCS